eukprot:scaffold13910_cov149-Amphora_coffeaeformis.AAC.2
MHDVITGRSCTGILEFLNQTPYSSPGHETPLASGVSTNVSVDVDTRQHDSEADVDTRQYDSEADVDARQHDPGQDQDQPAFNRLWNNQYAALMELDM